MKYFSSIKIKIFLIFKNNWIKNIIIYYTDNFSAMYIRRKYRYIDITWYILYVFIIHIM